MRAAALCSLVLASSLALACSSDPAPPSEDGTRLGNGGSPSQGPGPGSAGTSSSGGSGQGSGGAPVTGDDTSGDDTGASDPDYAPGPYGTTEGSIAKNLSFLGLVDPKAVNYDSSNLQLIQFKDFYNPTKDPSKPLVLVIAASALWCGPCQQEAQTSVSHWNYWNPKGVQFLTTVFQDLDANPAQPKDLTTWTSNYKLTYPVVIDPDAKMGLFVDYTAIPYNLVIDTTTMKILYAQAGLLDTSSASSTLKKALGQ